VKIATGQPEDHPTPLPLDASGLPGVQQPTVREPGSDSPANAGSQIGGVYDGTGARQAQMGALESECAAAQSYGMSADGARRDHYAQTMSPLGASYGDDLPIPPVPSAAVPPAMSDLYPYGGLEPTPADAGFAGEYGGS
jgi:hypothetical protein